MYFFILLYKLFGSRIYHNEIHKLTDKFDNYLYTFDKKDVPYYNFREIYIKILNYQYNCYCIINKILGNYL